MKKLLALLFVITCFTIIPVVHGQSCRALDCPSVGKTCVTVNGSLTCATACTTLSGAVLGLANSCVEDNYFCDREGNLGFNCERCGCPTGHTCENNECVLRCADGTVNGQCSQTKPQYCDLGELVNHPELCGCPQGTQEKDGLCEFTHCFDDTPNGQCSTVQPYFCEEGVLTEDPVNCGCPEGTISSSKGTCGRLFIHHFNSSVQWERGISQGIQDRGDEIRAISSGATFVSPIIYTATKNEDVVYDTLEVEGQGYRIKVRTAPSVNGEVGEFTEFVGPDGSDGSFTPTSANTLSEIHNDHVFFQYEVTFDQGGFITDMAMHYLGVYNPQPIANIDVIGDVRPWGLPITLVAQVQDDEQVESVRWFSVDGQESTSNTFSFIGHHVGVQPVILEVIDNDGASTRTFTNVTVLDPDIVFGLDGNNTAISFGETYNLSFSGQTADNVDIFWTINGVTKQGKRIEHTFNRRISQRIEVKMVTKSGGSLSTSGSASGSSGSSGSLSYNISLPVNSPFGGGDCFSDSTPGKNNHYFNIDDPIVEQTAQEALEFYANRRNVSVASLQSPLSVYEAITYYLSQNFGYKYAPPPSIYPRPATFGTTVTWALTRHIYDLDPSGWWYANVSRILRDSSARDCGSKFCGDDVAMAATTVSLMRNLGVDSTCTYMACHYDFENYFVYDFAFSNQGKIHILGPRGIDREPIQGRCYNVLDMYGKKRISESWYGTPYALLNRTAKYEMETVFNDVNGTVPKSQFLNLGIGAAFAAQYQYHVEYKDQYLTAPTGWKRQPDRFANLWVQDNRGGWRQSTTLQDEERGHHNKIAQIKLDKSDPMPLIGNYYPNGTLCGGNPTTWNIDVCS